MRKNGLIVVFCIAASAQSVTLASSQPLQTRSWTENEPSSYGKAYCKKKTGESKGQHYSASGTLGLNGSHHALGLYICDRKQSGKYTGILRLEYNNNDFHRYRIDLATSLKTHSKEVGWRGYDFRGWKGEVIIAGAVNCAAKSRTEKLTRQCFIGDGDGGANGGMHFEVISYRRPIPQLWTITALRLDDDRPWYDGGRISDNFVRDITNAPDSLADCASNLFRCVEEEVDELAYNAVLPLVESYIEYLSSQGSRYSRLSNQQISVLAKYYKSIDLSQVKFYQNIDTVHGQAITIDTSIYFPRYINLNNRDDLGWLMHELEHVSQYSKFGRKKLISNYLVDSVKLIGGKASFNVHDSISLERDAENLKNRYLDEVYKYWPIP